MKQKKQSLTELIHSREQKFPLLMGIVNLTDDSFHDGGKFNQLDKALYQIEKLIVDGADIIDLGAESSRPGARQISLDTEFNRLLPVLEAVISRFDCFISIDTYKPEVMQKSVELGANMINDIYALTKPNTIEAASQLNVPVCVMHMQNNPQTMQKNPQYDNVIKEVFEFLANRVESCKKAGIKNEHLIVDVGFGFGKTLEHNLILLNQLEKFKLLEAPILVGLSQKSMLGKMLQSDSEPRQIPSVICALFAAKKGVRILRVHDVFETKQALITASYLLD